MKKYTIFSILVALGCAQSLPAQRLRPPSAGPDVPTTGDYATDVGVVLDSQGQALEQAQQMLTGGTGTADHTALEAAIKEMERSRAALEDAKKSPEKLSTALAAEQSAYQALLKAIPPEYRVSRTRNQNQRSSSGSSGQPGEQELNQLDLNQDDNRYQNERQAATPQTPRQSEAAQTADRLKELARRQQDLNDRMRDLQTALTEARTEQARQEAQQQLKRLQDEERQMLSDVDELRQQLEQSPNAEQQADARQQLDQTRNDVQRASQQMENQSVSEALASGSRAEESLQNLRETERQQSSSQFAQQMRQLQGQANDLAAHEEQIASDLSKLNDAAQKPLDDSAQRQSLVQQLTRQENALTNLVGGMRALTEQAETTEPLLAKQLYDVLRHEDQTHTDSQLEIGAQLVDRGFLPQAAQTESIARTNIDQLRQSVDTAAESVLGSEADALRYAQRELDDLSGQLAREIAEGTNSAAAARGANGSRQGQAGNRGGAANQNGNGRGGTNEVAGATPGDSNRGGQQPGGGQNSQQNGRNGGREGQGNGENAQNDSSQGQRQGGARAGRGAGAGQEQANANGQGGGQPGDDQNAQQDAQNAGRGGRGGQGEMAGQGQPGQDAQGGDQAQAGDDQNGQRGDRNGGRGGRGGGNNRGGNAGDQAGQDETAAQDQAGADGQGGGEAQAGDDQNGQPGARNGGRGGRAGGGNNRGGNAGDQARAGGADENGGQERLRQFAVQLGGAGNGGMGGGPVTGNNYVDWSDRMRDVEQAVDSQDVRNQLATVRERVGAYRQDFRQNGRVPTKEELQSKALAPLNLAREWVEQELARVQKDRSLVPLDRDPVQAKYSEAVRQYYEKLGSPQ